MHRFDPSQNADNSPLRANVGIMLTNPDASMILRVIRVAYFEIFEGVVEQGCGLSFSGRH